MAAEQRKCNDRKKEYARMVQGRKIPVSQGSSGADRTIQEELCICCDEAGREITVDRGEMKNTFNPEEGFSRTRPLEAGLNHLRIFTDASSVEIFVNDGDVVFTSRVFPSESEHWFTLHGNVFPRLWTIRQAVKDSFLI